MATSVQIVIDCLDPGSLSEFWADALHYVAQPPPPGFESWEAFLIDRGVPESEWNSASAVTDPDGSGPRIYFQRVPETKSTKNRLHLDFNISGGPATPLEDRKERVAAEVQRLVAVGATEIRPMDERGEHWVIMNDPEGNEFCVH